MPKLTKVQFAELVRSMPGASDDDVLAAAQKAESTPAEEPSTLKKVWDFANTPLTDAPSRLAKKSADQIDAPSLTSERDTIDIPGFGKFNSRGFVAGITQGAGDVASSLTSPLNLAFTALGFGGEAAAARGLTGVSKGAQATEMALQAPLVAEGGYNVAQGIKDKNLGQAGAGAAEAAGGLAGMRSSHQRLNAPRAASSSTIPHTPESPAIETAGASPSGASLTPEEIAVKAAELHNAKGGSTFSLKSGQVSETPMFSVSTFPGRELKVPSKEVHPQQMRDFIKKNQDVLGQDNTNFGSWFNPEDGNTYLDVSTMVPSLDEALALGQKHNQLAVYDHANAKTIDVPKAGTTASAPAVTPLAGNVPPEFHAVEARTGEPTKGLEAPPQVEDQPFHYGSGKKVADQKQKLDAFRAQAAQERLNVQRLEQVMKALQVAPKVRRAK